MSVSHRVEDGVEGQALDEYFWKPASTGIFLDLYSNLLIQDIFSMFIYLGDSKPAKQFLTSYRI